MNLASPISVDRDLTSAVLQLVSNLADQLHPGSDFARSLGIDHSLERDYGLDSLARVELATRIESELGVSLDEALLSQAETPHDLLRAIVTAPASASTVSAPDACARRFVYRISARLRSPPWSTFSTGTRTGMAIGC